MLNVPLLSNSYWCPVSYRIKPKYKVNIFFENLVPLIQNQSLSLCIPFPNPFVTHIFLIDKRVFVYYAVFVFVCMFFYLLFTCSSLPLLQENKIDKVAPLRLSLDMTTSVIQEYEPSCFPSEAKFVILSWVLYFFKNICCNICFCFFHQTEFLVGRRFICAREPQHLCQ